MEDDEGSRTGSEDVSAHLGGIQVVVDKGINESGDLAADNEVASGLETVNELSNGVANLLKI